MNLFTSILFHYRAWRLQRLIRKWRHEHWPVARLPAPSKNRTLANANGFSLLEILFVLTVLAFLTIGVVKVGGIAIERAQANEAMTLAASTESTILDVYQATGLAPSSEPTAGMSGDVAGKYGSLAVYTAGALGYTFNSNAMPALQGKLIAFIPYTDGSNSGVIFWTCGFAAPKTGWSTLTSDGSSGGGPLSAASTTVPVTALPPACRAGG